MQPTFWEQNLEAVVALGLAGVGFIIWLIRLEGKMKAHEEIDALRFSNLTERQDDLEHDQKDQRSRHDQLEDKILEKLSTIEKSLANIDGQLRYQKE